MPAMEAIVETAMSTSRHLCASTVRRSCQLCVSLLSRWVFIRCFYDLLHFLHSGATCARLRVVTTVGLRIIAHYVVY